MNSEWSNCRFPREPLDKDKHAPPPNGRVASGAAAALMENVFNWMKESIAEYVMTSDFFLPQL